MRSFRSVWTAVAASFALINTSSAQNVNASDGGWDFDSINPVHPTQTASQIAAGEVYVAIVRGNALWNAHDLEGYLDTFWRSRSLVFIEDNAVISGWQQFHDRSVRGFNRPEAMGKATADRVQIRMINLDYAFVITHWTLASPASSHAVVGVDSTGMQLVDGAWKVVHAHTSYLEM